MDESAVDQVGPPSLVQRSGTVTSPILDWRAAPLTPLWSLPAPATPEKTTPEMQLKRSKAALVVSVAFTGPMPVSASITGLPSSVPVQNSLLLGAGERIGSVLSRWVAFMIWPISAGKADRSSRRDVAHADPGPPLASALAGPPTSSMAMAATTAIRRKSPSQVPPGIRQAAGRSLRQLAKREISRRRDPGARPAAPAGGACRS